MRYGQSRLAVFLAAVCLAVAVSASMSSGNGGERYRKFAELNGKAIGVITGTHFEYIVNQTLDLTRLHFFTTLDEMVAALRQGEVECVVDDEPILRIYAKADSGLRILDEPLQRDKYAFAVNRGDVGLAAQLNLALNRMRVDGSVKAIVERWMSGAGVFTPAEEAGEKDAGKREREIRLGVYVDTRPFVYCDAAGTVGGIDIDVLREMCRRLNYGLRIIPMEFDAMFDAVQAKEVDVIAACIAITDDRKQMVYFTQYYYEGGVAAMVRE